jgi:hypothetical protein
VWVVMLEKDFQAAVVELARWHGWKVHHTRTVQIAGGGWLSPGLDKGFPDLVLARDGDVIVAELKTDNGRLTVSQGEWLKVLGTVVEAVVWRPRDMSLIHERLAPIRSHVRRSHRV